MRNAGCLRTAHIEPVDVFGIGSTHTIEPESNLSPSGARIPLQFAMSPVPPAGMTAGLHEQSRGRAQRQRVAYGEIAEAVVCQQAKLISTVPAASWSGMGNGQDPDACGIRVFANSSHRASQCVQIRSTHTIEPDPICRRRRGIPLQFAMTVPPAGMTAGLTSRLA